jgi:hypothetical protein
MRDALTRHQQWCAAEDRLAGALAELHTEASW